MTDQRFRAAPVALGATGGKLGQKPSLPSRSPCR